MPQTVLPFENHISVEAAYKLICLYNADLGGRDAISARGWLKYSSWYNDRMPLADGSFIMREPYVDGHCIHYNYTADDLLDIDWEALGIPEFDNYQE